MNDQDKSHDDLLEKAKTAQLSHAEASLFMNKNAISLKANYTIRGTIEIFRVHHIGGATVVDYKDQVIGVISEYDLLIQAASKPISGPIAFQTKVIAIFPETTLKEVLVILYKQKLKWIPVVNSGNFLQGVVSRIDVLNFIATQSDL